MGKLIFAILVFVASFAHAGSVTQDQAPGFDVKMINALLAGPNPEGPNCASTALLATGSLKIPIFIDPYKLQQLFNDPLCAHMATGPIPGTIGTGIDGNEYVHFFAILKGGVAFQRGNTSDHFSIIPLAQAESQFGTRNDFHQWTGGPECELDIFQKYINSGKADPAVKGAIAYLNKSFALPYDQKAKFDIEKAKTLFDDYTKGRQNVIFQGRGLNYYLARILKDAIYSQDPHAWDHESYDAITKEAAPALKLIMETVKENSADKWLQKAADAVLAKLAKDNYIIYITLPLKGPGDKFDIVTLSDSCPMFASENFDAGATAECDKTFNNLPDLPVLFAAYQSHPNPDLTLAPPVDEPDYDGGVKEAEVRYNAIYAGKPLAFLFFKP